MPRPSLRLLCHPLHPTLRLTALIIRRTSFPALIARPSSTCLMASRGSGALNAKLTWLMSRSSSLQLSRLRTRRLGVLDSLTSALQILFSFDEGTYIRGIKNCDN
ncbi:hypothetical protein ACFX15_031856 [Malus domestica]